MLADPLFQLVVGGALALLLASAAWHKAGDAPRFRAQLLAYALLPPGLVDPVARLLPVLEGAVALALLIPAARGPAAGTAAALFVAYAAAMLINLLRGRRHIDCGCGGRSQPLSWGLVLRNGALAGAALALVQPPLERSFSGGDLFAIALLMPILLLTYAAAEEILRNGALLRNGVADES